MKKVLGILVLSLSTSLAFAADFVISVQSSGGSGGGSITRKLYDGNNVKFAEVGFLNQERFFLTDGQYAGYVLAGNSSDYSDLNEDAMPLMFNGANLSSTVCLHDQADCVGPCKLTVPSTSFVPKPIDAIYKKGGSYYKTMKNQQVFVGLVTGVSRSFGNSCQNLATVQVPSVFEGQGYIVPTAISDSGFPKATPISIKLEK